MKNKSVTGGGESAFSLVETLAAILVLSLLAGLGFGAVRVSGDSSGRGLREILLASRLLETEEYLRRETGRVELPFWASDSALSLDGTSVLVGYYEGQKNAMLKLSCSDGFLKLSSPKDARRLGPFERVTFEALRLEEGTPIGIRVIVEENGKEVSIDCVFSAIPIRFGFSR